MKGAIWPFAAAVAMAMQSSAAPAAPVARFAEVSYQALDAPQPAQGDYSNPILPGFHPDPSIVRVGKDFYLVTSTFGWFPGLPIFHSTDLVHWQQIGNAIDRTGMVDLSGLSIVGDGLYAPAITFHDGTFYILNTCVRCGGNYLVTATDPAGPWSDPLWLDFDGIDPSLFVDGDGRGWITYNDLPEGGPQYEGHRAIWLQGFDLATGRLAATRTQLVDGGVHPEDKPIWAEGPHLYQHDGWYFLMPAEGGTADQHSQTIYRSRSVTGPYEAGPFNPILTQRDLPADRPNRVEATGHADLVELADGSWWGVFLATRPFTGQSTLLGRESFLLPVRWIDGWPRFLDRGEPVPMEAKAPNLPASPGTDWSHWTEKFDGTSLSPAWLQMRNPAPIQWFALDRDRDELQLVAGVDSAGSRGQPHFLGRRLRHPLARIALKVDFAPDREGDFAGLLALMAEHKFLALGIEQRADGARQIVARRRASFDEDERGVTIASTPFAGTGAIELSLTIDEGTAELAWRPAGRGAWKNLAKGVDIEPFASIHSGLFTGVVVGPYAVEGSSAGD